jgi:hypothetical protein
MYIHLYIHYPLFAANRSWPLAVAHLDFWLASARNRTSANATELPQTQQPRTHKPLVAGSNPAAATKIRLVQAKNEDFSSEKGSGIPWSTPISAPICHTAKSEGSGSAGLYTSRSSMEHPKHRTGNVPDVGTSAVSPVSAPLFALIEQCDHARHGQAAS